MRWDQLEELVSAIKNCQPKQTTITLTPKLIENALSKIADPFLNTCEPFKDFVESEKYERHDFSKARIWEVKGAVPRKCKADVTLRGNRHWFNVKSGFEDFSDLPYKCVQVRPGVLKFQ